MECKRAFHEDIRGSSPIDARAREMPPGCGANRGSPISSREGRFHPQNLRQGSPVPLTLIHHPSEGNAEHFSIMGRICVYSIAVCLRDTQLFNLQKLQWKPPRRSDALAVPWENCALRQRPPPPPPPRRLHRRHHAASIAAASFNQAKPTPTHAIHFDTLSQLGAPCFVGTVATCLNFHAWLVVTVTVLSVVPG